MKFFTFSLVSVGGVSGVVDPLGQYYQLHKQWVRYPKVICVLTSAKIGSLKLLAKYFADFLQVL